MFDEAAIEATLRQLCPLYKHVELSVESAQDGVYRCRVPLNAANGNHLGTVHAAIQWAAAEMLGGLVLMPIIGPHRLATMHVAVRSVSIDFRRPARSAIIAEALFDEQEASEVRRLIDDGKDATFCLHAVVRDDNGETVATTEAVYVARPLRAAKTGAGLDHAIV
ncbi:YiiD C-terminal domain-containing protein [Sphingopyxis fribergensis]|jgi:acyl-coenzyme A thioesterase PaaI-like protein